MQTLKTAVVVVLLLVVFYGVYEMLNRAPDPPPSDVAMLDDIPFDPPEIQFGEVTGLVPSEPSFSVSSTATGDALTSPVPAQSMAAPGLTTAPADAPAPPSAPFASDSPFPSLPAAHPNHPMSVEPPNLASETRVAQATVLPPPLASPMADRAVTYDPRLQSNPFVHEPVVVRPTDGSTSPHGDQTGIRAYEQARRLAQSMIAEGKYVQALAALSVFYESEDLTGQEQQELLDVLDPLAGRVVYSREHCIEPPHKVRHNETLFEIAQRYDVPPALLQKINGIQDPNVLVPGHELKVVTGPFRADVDLRGQHLTLFLNGLYAGRFPITVGGDPAPVEGEFTVRDKREDRDYFSLEGRQIPAGNPANPFGHVWLDLGREVSIHGSPSGGADAQRGCISLSPKDADDVYGILSIGSTVRILR